MFLLITTLCNNYAFTHQKVQLLNFMTSVSAHGGLVHVVMVVDFMTGEGIKSLVRNSSSLITLVVSAKQ